MTLPQGMTDTFLEAIKARLAALEESASVPLFKRVWIAPFLDVKRFMQNPTDPAAIVLDRGGSWNPHNGQVVTRRFAVGVIDCVARDHVGEASAKAVLNRGDIMTAELMNGGDDEAAYQVMEVLDGELEAVGDDEGPLIVLCKEYPCTAKLDRQALEVGLGRVHRTPSARCVSGRPGAARAGTGGWRCARCPPAESARRDVWPPR
jgi:hypothetical protein